MLLYFGKVKNLKSFSCKITIFNLYHFSRANAIYYLKLLQFILCYGYWKYNCV